MGTRQAHHSTDQADLGAGQVNRRQRARVWCLSRDRKEVAAVADGALQTRTATGPMLQTCRIAPEPALKIPPSTSAAAIVRRGPIDPESLIFEVNVHRLQGEALAGPKPRLGERGE